MVTWLVVVGFIGSFYWLYLVDWFVNWLYGLLVSVVEKTQTAEIQNPNQFYQAQSIRLKHFKLQKLWAKLGKIEENLARGYHQGGKQIELAAKMAQDASKSGFKEALEGPWRRLGMPKRVPRGSKIDAWRVFFWS